MLATPNTRLTNYSTNALAAAAATSLAAIAALSAAAALAAASLAFIAVHSKFRVDSLLFFM